MQQYSGTSIRGIFASSLVKSYLHIMYLGMYRFQKSCYTVRATDEKSVLPIFPEANVGHGSPLFRVRDPMLEFEDLVESTVR